MNVQQDRQLLQKAKALSAFKRHLSVYLMVMVLLWLTWFFGNVTSIIAWPVYPSAGWGLILFFHFLSVYRLFRTGRRQQMD